MAFNGKRKKRFSFSDVTNPTKHNMMKQLQLKKMNNSKRKNGNEPQATKTPIDNVENGMRLPALQKNKPITKEIKIRTAMIITLIILYSKERDWMIEMLDMTAKVKAKRWNDLKIKMKMNYDEKIEPLSQMYEEKLKSKTLKEGYVILKHERTLLKECVTYFDPNNKRNVCWESDYKEICDLQDECDFYQRERLEYFKNKSK
eukprot:141791_1